MSQTSDEFSGRMGLIFAAIGAAIGTGNIWRFPRMVGANDGGTFLIPWLFFLFVWSIPLVIAEFALGKRSRTGTIGTFRIFAGKGYAWDGSMDSMDLYRYRILLCSCCRMVPEVFPVGYYQRTGRRKCRHTISLE